MTRPQRKTLATAEIMKAVGATTSTEKDVANTAALEAVKEQLLADPGFRETFRQKYDEILHLATGGGRSSGTRSLGPMPQPKPSAHLATHNPLANLSPYDVADAWEHRDFRSVLEHAGRNLLREMVGVVLAREPKEKPPNRNQEQAMIDWITLHVLGPDY